jgi:O-antigen/teichoic acid export membrane protein
VAERGRLAHRISFGVADQLLSSGSNFVAMLVGARTLDVEGFGVYAFALLTFTFTLGVVRALCSEALLVRPGEPGDEHWSRVRSATGAAFWLGILVGVVLAVAALASSGAASRSMLVLAVALPGLLVQDTLRYAAFARGEPKAALVSDATWVVGLAILFGILFARAEPTAPWLLAAFVAPGVVAGLLQALRERVLPVLRDGFRWVAYNGDLSGRYTLDFLSGAGAAQLAAYVLVAVTSVAALGSLRGAQTLFGPINILFTGVSTVLVPEGRRTLARSTSALFRLSLMATTFFFIGSSALLAAYLMLSDSQGEALLGSTWVGAQALLLPVGLASIGGSVMAGPASGLRSLEAAAQVLRIRMIVLPTTIAIPALGAVFGGATGMAWGIAASVWWNVLWYWIGYRAELRAYVPAAAADPQPS